MHAIIGDMRNTSACVSLAKQNSLPLERALNELLPPFQAGNFGLKPSSLVVVKGYTTVHPKWSNHVGGILGHKCRQMDRQIANHSKG